MLKTKTRCYKAGYEVRKELIDPSMTGGKEIIMKVAYTPSGDYIGDPKWAYLLCKKRGIKPEKASPDHKVCSIGFCDKEQKWYGWSHRAIYGFGIGSTCKKGDCHYRPSTPQELFDSITQPDSDGWRWQNPDDVEMTATGVRIKTRMCKSVAGGEPVSADIISKCDAVIDMAGDPVAFQECEPSYWEIEVGRGEWVAKTLDDAKQMAIDFAESVS